MKKAFTLIELIVVIVIVGILAGVAIPNIAKSKMVANESAAQANLKIISAAAENYLAVRDAYPTAESNLTTANPPYLNRSYCGQTIQGYVYGCGFQATGYVANAAPSVCGQGGAFRFSVTTGGNLTQSGC